MRCIDHILPHLAPILLYAGYLPPKSNFLRQISFNFSKLFLDKISTKNNQLGRNNSPQLVIHLGYLVSSI